jgi:hypothetical protein
MLLVAGGAAEIAAAFNTPLAGVMFAIEELSRTPEHRNSGLIVTAVGMSASRSMDTAGRGNCRVFTLRSGSTCGHARNDAPGLPGQASQTAVAHGMA